MKGHQEAGSERLGAKSVPMQVTKATFAVSSVQHFNETCNI